MLTCIIKVAIVIGINPNGVKLVAVVGCNADVKKSSLLDQNGISRVIRIAIGGASGVGLHQIVQGDIIQIVTHRTAGGVQAGGAIGLCLRRIGKANQ